MTPPTATDAPADARKRAVKEASELVKRSGAQMIDIRFMDFLGQQQHFSIPASKFEPDIFEEGLGFDGSSIRGWKSIHESDMLVLPDPATAFVDPFFQHPTVVMLGDIHEPNMDPFRRCPRGIAKRAELYLKKSGIADVCYMGPEAEFFVFDHASYDEGPNQAFYKVDSDEGGWNRGKSDSLGYKPTTKGGYFPCPPTDSLQNLRAEMVLHMEKIGIEIEAQHHEVASGGQCEIDFKFCPLVKCADTLSNYKYIVKNTAWKYGKTVTFMPKPIFGDNGSGMHVHISLWKGKDTLMFGKKYAGLSQEALWFIGGILHHAPAVIAFTNPTTNSFRRLVPGFEAPVNLVYSARNRSAAIRIPMYSESPKAKRIEARFPDPSCNPYLAFPALLMAGLDGIKKKMDPGKGIDQDIYHLTHDELVKLPQAPKSLEEALDALERDHKFLLEGDVFSEDVIQAWIAYKYENEVQQIRMRPHPFEFS
ncbi:MAG: type I glutamate--ammonia ligase, partial [Candidatus Eremiobacterota bacterium]